MKIIYLPAVSCVLPANVTHEDALWGLRQAGRRLERYVEDFIELIELILSLPLLLENAGSPQLTPCREPPHTAPMARRACPNPNTPCSISVLSPESPSAAHSSQPFAWKYRPPSAATSSPPFAMKASLPTAGKFRPPATAHSRPPFVSHASVHGPRKPAPPEHPPDFTDFPIFWGLYVHGHRRPRPRRPLNRHSFPASLWRPPVSPSWISPPGGYVTARGGPIERGDNVRVLDSLFFIFSYRS